MASIIRRAGVVVAVSGIAWWLFADTYARHVPSWMDKSEIRFAHFGSFQDYALWRDLIRDFERRHPDIRIHQEYVVGLGGRYHTKMRQQILSHTLPDVALIQLGPFHDLAEHFADLTPLLRSSVGENIELAASLDGLALKAFQVQGRQRALPVSGGNLLVFGNRECFTRASQFRGIPIPIPEDDWNINDFRRIAGLLTCDFDGVGRSDQVGFWLPRWIYYLPFLWSFGAELTDDRMTEWTLYGTEAEAALSFYQDLAVTDHV
ncbi:MAG: extracellular solute-binding protein, partial [Planctomycetes bacterium]|nr:extracellular solute-binding protein [Planctomycetota bacterium]